MRFDLETLKDLSGTVAGEVQKVVNAQEMRDTFGGPTNEAAEIDDFKRAWERYFNKWHRKA